MGKACSDCAKLNLKKEKHPGCYLCKQKTKEKKKDTYMWACEDACDKFDFDFGRKSSKRKDIYHDAFINIHKDYSKISGGQLFALFAIFFLIWLFATLSNLFD